MCYPKPGPRCSSAARKDLIHAKAAAKRNRTVENTFKVREAEEEYYKTPAGFRELKRLISIGERPEYNQARLEHYTQERKQQIADLKMKDVGDIQNEQEAQPQLKSTNNLPLHQLPGTETRHGWETLTPEQHEQKETEYINSSAAWVDRLTIAEITAVRWFTSNGFHEMGQQDRKEDITLGYDSQETQEEANKRISRMRKTLNSALRKADQEPRIVYRGVGRNGAPKELLSQIPENRYTTKPQYASDEEYEQAKTAYFDNLLKQKTFTFDRPASTTLDPRVAEGFSHSQYAPSVMYEISTRKGAPVGAASAWGASETEIILPATTKYRVVDIKHDINIKVINGRTEEPDHRTTTIIQLEEI
jgi:hypothetical protein